MGEQATQPRRTPARWANRMMALALRTPLLQRLAGRGTALLTFTGRSTGRRYTTPVSYVRRDNTVVLTCHPSRQWWRNLESRPVVALRLAGRDHEGRAVTHRGGESALADLVAFLEGQPFVARAYDVPLKQGRVDQAAARTLLDDFVVVTVDLEAS